MKQPVGLIPITIPHVVIDTNDDGTITLWVENLKTITGPEAFKGRHAWLRLTASQAEVLVRGLAAQLHIDVVNNDDEPVA